MNNLHPTAMHIFQESFIKNIDKIDKLKVKTEMPVKYIANLLTHICEWGQNDLKQCYPDND